MTRRKLGSLCGRARRHEQTRAEIFRRFIHRHARRIGGQFVKRAARLANVKRIEILAVVDVHDRVPKLRLHGFHFRLVTGAEGDMVEGAASRRAGPKTLGITNIDRIAGFGQHARDRPGLHVAAIIEISFEEGGGFTGQFRQQCNAADATDGIARGDRRARPCRCFGKTGNTRQLDDHAVRVLQPDRRLAQFGNPPHRGKAESQGSRQPEADAFRIDGQCHLADLSMPRPSRRTVFPDQKGDQRAGRSGTITIDQVQLRRILEAGCALDQAQTQKTDIEVDIRLNFPCDQREVMNSRNHAIPFHHPRRFSFPICRPST